MKKTPKNIPTYYNSKGTPIYRDTTAVLFNNGGDKKTPPKKSKPTSTLPSATPFPSIGNPLLVNQGLVNLGYNPLDGNVQYIGPQNPNAGTESFFNPMNWNVPRMDTEPTFEGAFEKAKRAGHGEFIYNGKRYTTESNMTPAQQMQSYGITDSRRILNPSQARINLSTLNTEEGYSGGAEAAIARMLGVSPGMQFTPNEGEAPGAKEQDAFKLYLGLPQTYNTFKPSNYKKGALELTNYNALLPDTMPSDADIKKYGVPEYSDTWKKGNPLKPYNDFVMGRHTVQKGKDAKGEYIEYIDKWDLDTFGKAGEYADYLNQPFDIYGRKYYKDYGDGVKKTMYYSDQELQSFDPNNKNFDTLALQKELANRGYKFPKSTTKAGELDGVYGEETKKALLDWQNKNFKEGEIYSFSDRPGSYYKYNEDGTMLIKNKNTNGKYIPMVDKEGKRLKTLQAGLISGKTKKLLDGGPLVDKTNHGDLLPSVYASALGNYYAQGGMIKRADGSYSPRGLWDNIRAAAAKNKAAGKSGKEPSKEILAQAKKIEAEEKQLGGYLYGRGGQFPTPYNLPEDSFKQGGDNLHNSIYASSLAQYPAVYKYGGSFEMPRQQMYMPLDNVERYGGYQQNAKTFSAGGENHKVYMKTSPTGNGEGIQGHIMVNHPTKDKGQWDTIDLTEKAGAKTVAQGVAATKQWHAEHPNQYAEGGMLNGPGDPIKTQFGRTVSLADQNEYNKRLQYYNLSKNLQNYINTEEGHIPNKYRGWVSNDDVLKGYNLQWKGWYPDIYSGTKGDMTTPGYFSMIKYRKDPNFYYDIQPDAWYHVGAKKGNPEDVRKWGVPTLYPYWFKPVLEREPLPEIGKLPTKKLPQLETEIIPTNYNYIPQKHEPIQVANRSQTIMEPDPNREGKYRVKELRQVPYSVNFPGEGWQPANAPRVLYIDSKGNEVEERPKELKQLDLKGETFANGGSILSMSNTPQLEGEGKDLTYPKNAYIYAVGGAINNFNDGGAMNFKSKGAYQKWLAYGHASGEFAKTPGNQPVSIKGKSHNVEHQYGGALFAAGGSFNNPGFNALPTAVQNKIRANSYEAGGTMDQLTEFNAGGTHEENPLGGIPQGMSPDGRLNLVEQGETKLKETDAGGGNFVYSDSIKVDRQFAEEYSLPNSYIGKTYAEASKLANRPKSRRENDTIEQTDIKRKLDSLAEAQEAQKAKEQQEQTAQELAANPQLLEALTQQLAANQSVQPMGMPQGEEVSPDQVPPEMLAQMEGAQQGMPIMRCGGHMYMCGGKMYDFGGWVDNHSNTISGAATGAMTGAATGAAFGPWGALGGLVIGGIAGGVGGNKKDQQEEDIKNATKQDQIAQGNMMQRIQDPSYVTPTAQYALNAGAGTGATYTYPVKKGGPIYHQYPQINPMWKNNAGPMGQGLANTQVYAMGGNMMAKGGPAKLTAQEQATIQKEWEATYGKLPAGQQVFIDQSSYDNWKKTGNLEGIYSLDIPPATATKTAESADNQFYYTDYATGQPIYDVDPITGEKIARLAPEGSKQNIQYPQYAAQAAGAPQVQAKKQAVQDEIMRNQNLIKQLSQEQLQEMRSLKMTPEAYIQEKQVNVLPFGQAGAYTFADGGVINSFDPSLMAATENNFIRKLREGGDEDYSEEDMAVDRITISEIKAKINNGEELTDADKAAYQSALERLNEGLDSQDLDFGIKVKPIELAAMAAPAAYNIGTGLFGKVQQLNPEDYTVKGQIDPYQYNIAPELREAGYGFAAGQDALRNASTGSAYLSNVQGLYNTRNKYMSELYSKKQNLDAANYQAAQQANLELQQQNAASRLGILDWNARAQNAKRMALQEGLKETADIGKAFVDMRGQRALVKSYAPDYADTLKFLLDKNNKGE